MIFGFKVMKTIDSTCRAALTIKLDPRVCCLIINARIVEQIKHFDKRFKRKIIYKAIKLRYAINKSINFRTSTKFQD